MGNLSVVECHCVRNSDFSFSARSVTNVSLEDSDVSNNTYPIRVESGVNVSVTGNTVLDNGGVFTEAGIHLVLVAGGLVEGNRIDRTNGPAILLERTMNVTVRNNGLPNPRYTGIESSWSEGDIYVGNWISGSGIAGIDLAGPRNVTVTGNTILDAAGIRVREGRNLTFHNNAISNGSLQLMGFVLEDFSSHTIGPDNSVNGLPILYAVNSRGLDIVDGSYGQVILANVSRSRIASLLFRGTMGPQVSFVDNLTLEDLTVEEARGTGIDAFEVRNLVARNVRIEGSSGISIRVWRGTGVRIENVAAPGGIELFNVSEGYMRNSSAGQSVGRFVWGIHMVGLTDFVLQGNTIRQTEYGITVEFSANVSILDNVVTSNPFFRGTGLDVRSTQDVPIIGNILSNNYVGIRLENAMGANVHHNRVWGSSYHAMDDRGSQNAWDSGYPGGGNHWGDYLGWDDCEGANQDVCPTSVPVNDLVDGIGDFPYDIDSDSRDRYPLLDVDLMDELPVAMAVIVSPLPPIDAWEAVVFALDGSYDRDGTIVRCDWNFGDGTMGSGSPCPSSVSHVYESPGNYLFTLTVTDNRRGTGTRSQNVFVEASALVPYTHPSGFRLPIPENWGRSQDVLEDGSVMELRLVGSYNETTATIVVDTDVDLTIREDESYLAQFATDTVEDIRRDRADAVMDGSPAYRTVSGHLAAVFLIRYTSSFLTQKFVVIVSEAHDRYWLLVLTADGEAFPVLDSMFEQMVAGFEITLPPSAALPLITEGAILLLGGATAGAVVAFLLATILLPRSRKRTSAAIAPPPLPTAARSCPFCGAPIGPEDQKLCTHCGSSIFGSGGQSPGRPPGT